jgi:transketolase
MSDSLSTAKLGPFAQRFPERLINVGIAEQDLVGVSAGLANGGLVPFACTASMFLAGRALEQIRIDVAYSGYSVKLCGIGHGFGYGPLGPTHHGTEDVAWLRSIPDLPLIVAADPIETAEAVRFAAAHDGPVYLRVSRTPVSTVHDPGYRFELGRAVRLREGSDVTIIACGIVVADALTAAEMLTVEGIDARVVNMSTIRPIDTAEIVAAARETGGIVTVEEHSVVGGLGSAVAEVVVIHEPVPVAMVGVPGVFAPSGSSAWLRTHFGIDPAGIRDTALALARRRIHRVRVSGRA